MAALLKKAAIWSTLYLAVAGINSILLIQSLAQ